jgi:hypothetical protein
MALSMANRARERAWFKDPVWVGEYGMSWELPGADDYLSDLQALYDHYGFGSAYWEYVRGNSGFAVEDPEGNERPVVDVLVRPIPRRISGTPVTYGYAPFTRRWRITWTGGRDIDTPTEIFVPASRHYPDGFSVRSTDFPGSWDWDWDEETEILRVWHDPRRLSRTVTIVPG